MANPRDVNISIDGHNNLGRPTRAAANDIDKLERKLGRVGRTATRAADETDGAFKSIATNVRTAGPIGILALVTAIAAAAPIIGGTISAAITAGGVAGVIGLAAYMQKDNKEIKAAVKKLKKTVKDGLKDASKPLADDFAESIRQVTDSAKKNMPLVDRAFRAVEPSIAKLTDGFIGFVEGAAPGFVRMLEKSQPVIDAIAANLPRVGQGLGKFFDEIGDSAPDAAVAIGDVLLAIAGLLIMLGKLISFLSRVYVAFRNTFVRISTVVVTVMRAVVSTVTSAITGILRGVAKLAEVTGQRTMARKLRAAADEIDAAAGRIDRRLARVQATINSLRGKTVSITVRAQWTAGARRVANTIGVRGGNMFATSSWSPAFAAGVGAGSVRVESGPVSVDSRVFLDGRVIASTARTIVNESAARSAWRARTGRR